MNHFVTINSIDFVWIDASSKCDTGEMPNMLPGEMSINYTLHTKKGHLTGKCELPYCEDLSKIKQDILLLIYNQ